MIATKWLMCLQQVSVSNVGRVCTEPARPARPWGTCTTQTASPAAPAVSNTHKSLMKTSIRSCACGPFKPLFSFALTWKLVMVSLCVGVVCCIGPVGVCIWHIWVAAGDSFLNVRNCCMVLYLRLVLQCACFLYAESYCISVITACQNVMLINHLFRLLHYIWSLQFETTPTEGLASPVHF